jgi:hypothetical protein
MQKIFYSLITAIAALCAVSCNVISGNPADKAESYAKAIELTRKNVDGERFKIYSVSFIEMGELSNDLGLVTVKMVNKDDRAFSQSYYLSGAEPTDLREVQSVFEAPEYETTVGIDLGKLSPETIAAQIAEAKSMLPEGHTFKSVGRYEIEEEVPAGMSHFNRNKEPGKQTTSFTVRFTEDGKETESSAGKTSIIYYEGKATVNSDGSLSIEDN